MTVFQFMEGLTDRQEAFAVRDRLAWKYALSLELCDPGFDHTLSSPNFALVWSREMLNSVCWICFWSAVGKVDGSKPEGGNATFSTHVLAEIRALNRTLCVAQTMVSVLNVLSEVAPEWVRAHVPSEWVERYGERLEHERLRHPRMTSASSTPIKWELMGGRCSRR